MMRSIANCGFINYQATSDAYTAMAGVFVCPGSTSGAVNFVLDGRTIPLIRGEAKSLSGSAACSLYAEAESFARQAFALSP
jgi:hypothetical protein